MYKYFIAEHFKKQLKVYLKKHRSLLGDVIEALKTFQKERAIPLGANTYKLRLASSNIPKGKSHAFRMIILVLELDNLIAPIAIYFKGDRADISKQEIVNHANAIRQEIVER